MSLTNLQQIICVMTINYKFIITNFAFSLFSTPNQYNFAVLRIIWNIKQFQTQLDISYLGCISVTVILDRFRWFMIIPRRQQIRALVFDDVVRVFCVVLTACTRMSPLHLVL